MDSSLTKMALTTEAEKIINDASESIEDHIESGAFFRGAEYALTNPYVIQAQGLSHKNKAKPTKHGHNNTANRQNHKGTIP